LAGAAWAGPGKARNPLRKKASGTVAATATGDFVGLMRYLLSTKTRLVGFKGIFAVFGASAG
jgi:hypothetical protein